MMDVRCRCRSCDAQFKVAARYAGKKAKCPKCSTIVDVPAVDAADEDVPVFPTVPAGKAKTAAKPKRAVPIAESASLKPAAASPAPQKPAAATHAVSDAADAEFPLIDTERTSSAASADSRQSSALASRRSGRQKTNMTMWLSIGGGAALLIVVIVLFVLTAGGGSGGANNDEQGQPLLVLDWPADERSGAAVYVDGKLLRVPSQGDVSYPLAPGKHEVVLKRKGYEQIDLTVALDAGGRYDYSPRWKELETAFNSVFDGNTGVGGAGVPSGSTPPGYEGWHHNLDKAMEAAAAEQKEIVIAFVCSDAPGKSEALKNEVFATPEFRDFVDARFLTVVCDCPATETGYNNLVEPFHNQWMRSQYGVLTGAAVPSVFVTDAKGRPYGVAKDFTPGGGTQFLSQLAEIARASETRNQLLADVESASGAAKLDAAVAAVKWLDERDLTRFFKDEYRSWLPLGQQFDATNADGKFEVIFAADFFARIRTAMHESRAQIPGIVQELMSWKNGRTFRDKNRAAGMHMLASAAMISAGSRDEAARLMEAAKSYEPTDPKLVAALRMWERMFEDTGLAAMGSGFVVAADGYVLTNHHVIKGARQVRVILPDSKAKLAAKIIAQDPARDLALLKIDVPGGTKLTPLAVSAAKVRRGIDVAAFGYPVGAGDGSGLTLTQGVVSGLPDASNERMFVLSCLVNGGNSGGPLCNKRGQVIGVVTAKTVGDVGQDSYGLALPNDDVLSFLNKNLPDYSPQGDGGEAEVLGWDEVDARVSPSVMLIHNIQ